MSQVLKQKEVVLTQAQYDALATKVAGVVYKISDAKLAKTDLDASVQESLGKADTALQSTSLDAYRTSAAQDAIDASIKEDVFDVSTVANAAVKDVKNSDGTSLVTNNVANLPKIVSEVTLNGTSVVSSSEGKYVAAITTYDSSIAEASGNTNPLAANQGYLLNERINNISAIGRFLSVWDCSTGKPYTNPTSLPYAYKTGDYYVVGKVSDGATQLIPDGSSYTGAASTKTSTESINVNDWFYYDGTKWVWIATAEKDAVWGHITGNISDQTDLSSALAAKEVLANKVQVVEDSSVSYPSSAVLYGVKSDVDSSISTIKSTKEDTANKVTTIAAGASDPSTKFPTVGAVTAYVSSVSANFEKIANKKDSLSGVTTDASLKEYYASLKALKELKDNTDTSLGLKFDSSNVIHNLSTVSTTTVLDSSMFKYLYSQHGSTITTIDTSVNALDSSMSAIYDRMVIEFL